MIFGIACGEAASRGRVVGQKENERIRLSEEGFLNKGDTPESRPMRLKVRVAV